MRPERWCVGCRRPVPMRSTMLPSLRGLGPRRLPTPGPGRRLAPHRLLLPVLALLALAAAFFPAAAGRTGEASSTPAMSAGFTYRTIASPAEFAAAAGHTATPIPS